MDDSFDFESANPEIETLLASIAENSLETMAKNTEKFKSRFVQTNVKERITFIEDRENQNTKRKMNSSVKTFQQYLVNVKSEFRPLQEIPPNDLDPYLQEFFMGIRKETKENVPDVEREYQPSSLEGFQSLLNRLLRLNGYKYDLIKDGEFQNSRECLKAKKASERDGIGQSS